MKQLLALLLFVPTLCLAQLSSYVPTNGLVSWYPLDGDGADLGPYEDSLTPHGVTWSPDRFGQDQGACSFDGVDDYLLNDALNGLMESSSYSISFWIRKLAPSCEPLIVVSQWNSVASSGQSLHVGYRPCGQTGCVNGGCFFHDTYSNTCQTGSLTVDSTWHHLIVTSDVATGRRTIHEDGILLKEDFLESWQGNFSQGLLVGAHHYTSGFTESWMDGQLDELGIWNRALTEAEIQALFSGEAPEYGCTDQEACNYYDNANVDDGSCEYGCLYCGEGTVWDSTSTQCISIADTVFIEPEAIAPSCGPGTVWDPVNEECIIAIPADLNYDGCVSVNDLLVLLAVHGTCPPYPEWPDEPTDTTWACGDPLTYWDYDYATVLIGDQCWFAENLRTSLYSSGDSIPSNLSDFDWSTADLTGLGARTTYGEGLSNCLDYSPEINACNEAEAIELYGHLYNGYAALNSNGLCPVGWHVPTIDESFALQGFIGNNGFLGTEGHALKAQSGWAYDDNGSDDWGYTGLPSGLRTHLGNFIDSGTSGRWWSVSLSEDSNEPWTWVLFHNQSNITRYVTNWKYGLSVRCVKD